MKHENTEKTNELVKILAENCESINDVQELLKKLFKGTLEEMLVNRSQ